MLLSMSPATLSYAIRSVSPPPSAAPPPFTGPPDAALHQADRLELFITLEPEQQQPAECEGETDAGQQRESVENARNEGKRRTAPNRNKRSNRPPPAVMAKARSVRQLGVALKRYQRVSSQVVRVEEGQGSAGVRGVRPTRPQCVNNGNEKARSIRNEGRQRR